MAYSFLFQPLLTDSHGYTYIRSINNKIKNGTFWRCSFRSKSQKNPQGCKGAVLQRYGVFKVTQVHICQPVPNVHKLKQTISDATFEGIKQTPSSVTDLLRNSLQNNDLESTESFERNVKRRINYRRKKLGLKPVKCEFKRTKKNSEGCQNIQDPTLHSSESNIEDHTINSTKTYIQDDREFNIIPVGSSRGNVNINANVIEE